LKRKKAYFSHSREDFNTERAKKAKKKIASLGYTILDPSTLSFRTGTSEYTKWKTFFKHIKEADVLFYLPTLTSGVKREIRYAKRLKKKVRKVSVPFDK